MRGANILSIAYIYICKNSNDRVIDLCMHNQFLILKNRVANNTTVKIPISNFLVYFPFVPKKNNNQVDEYIKAIINKINIHCIEYNKTAVWKTSLYDRSYASVS